MFVEKYEQLVMLTCPVRCFSVLYLILVTGPSFETPWTNYKEARYLCRHNSLVVLCVPIWAVNYLWLKLVKLCRIIWDQVLLFFGKRQSVTVQESAVRKTKTKEKQSIFCNLDTIAYKQQHKLHFNCMQYWS